MRPHAAGEAAARAVRGAAFAALVSCAAGLARALDPAGDSAGRDRRRLRTAPVAPAPAVPALVSQAATQGDTQETQALSAPPDPPPWAAPSAYAAEAIGLCPTRASCLRGNLIRRLGVAPSTGMAGATVAAAPGVVGALVLPTGAPPPQPGGAPAATAAGRGGAGGPSASRNDGVRGAAWVGALRAALASAETLATEDGPAVRDALAVAASVLAPALAASGRSLPDRCRTEVRWRAAVAAAWPDGDAPADVAALTWTPPPVAPWPAPAAPAAEHPNAPLPPQRPTASLLLPPLQPMPGRWRCWRAGRIHYLRGTLQPPPSVATAGDASLARGRIAGPAAPPPTRSAPATPIVLALRSAERGGAVVGGPVAAGVAAWLTAHGCVAGRGGVEVAAEGAAAPGPLGALGVRGSGEWIWVGADSSGAGVGGRLVLAATPPIGWPGAAGAGGCGCPAE